MVLLVELLAQRDLRVLFPLSENLLVHPRDTIRGLAQTIPVRVFADRLQQQVHGFADLLFVNCCVVIWHGDPQGSRSIAQRPVMVNLHAPERMR